jgi:hypothetical protein
MTKIIDLDFYRKFRVILPTRSSKTAQSKAQASHRDARPLRRRRKSESDSKSPTKKEG